MRRGGKQGRGAVGVIDAPSRGGGGFPGRNSLPRCRGAASAGLGGCGGGVMHSTAVQQEFAPGSGMPRGGGRVGWMLLRWACSLRTCCIILTLLWLGLAVCCVLLLGVVCLFVVRVCAVDALVAG